jgi:hypothetical protein
MSVEKHVHQRKKKYVVNHKLEHVDDIRFREPFGKIRVVFIYKIRSALPSTRYLYLRLYSGTLSSKIVCSVCILVPNLVRLCVQSVLWYII